MWEYPVEIERVVDADTLDLRVDLGFEISVGIRVRLRGIDTPEIFGVKHSSEEYERGMAAKRWAEGWLAEAGSLSIRSHDAGTKGKYGRWIVDLHGSGVDDTLNDALVEAGHAEYVDYD